MWGNVYGFGFIMNLLICVELGDFDEYGCVCLFMYDMLNSDETNPSNQVVVLAYELDDNR